MKKLIVVAVLFLSGCSWEHDGKIVKDSDGNLFKLKSSGYRQESYDLEPLDKNELDSLLNHG